MRNIRCCSSVHGCCSSVPRRAWHPAGRIVIDTDNYYQQRDGTIAVLDSEQTTVSELPQADLPNSQVVKAFNHIRSGDLA